MQKVRSLLPECIIGTLFLALTLLLSPVLMARAHNDVYLPKLWASDPTLYRGYLTGDLITEDARDVLYRADDEWDAVSDSTFEFIDSSYQNNNIHYTGDACGVPLGVWYLQRSYGNSYYAATGWCYDGTQHITRSTVTFNTDKTWYTGTGTPSNGQADLWGIATHELGHATGFKKHLTGSYCPDNATRHTMCGYWDWDQTYWARTLEQHDEHSIAEAY